MYCFSRSPHPLKLAPRHREEQGWGCHSVLFLAVLPWALCGAPRGRRSRDAKSCPAAAVTRKGCLPPERTAVSHTAAISPSTDGHQEDPGFIPVHVPIPRKYSDYYRILLRARCRSFNSILLTEVITELQPWLEVPLVPAPQQEQGAQPAMSSKWEPGRKQPLNHTPVSKKQ